MTDHQQPVFHTNTALKQFEARVDGDVVFAATTAAPVKAFVLEHGGTVETPKPQSRSTARRMEQASRVQGGVGFSRSGRH